MNESGAYGIPPEFRGGVQFIAYTILYAVRAYRSVETQTPPRTLNGRQFVRTAQSKHKRLLALSTEDGGPHVVATWYLVLLVCSSFVPLN